MMRGASRAFRSARLTWQRLLKDERGSVLAFFVAIPVVAGTVAVGVETGQLYRIKRQMQGAADAAALAGAIDKHERRDQHQRHRRGALRGAAQRLPERRRRRDGDGERPADLGSERLDRERRRGDRHQAEQFSPGQRAQQLRSGSTLHHARALGGGAEQRDVDDDHDHERIEPRRLPRGAHHGGRAGVSFTSFNNFTSDCVVYSNGTSTGTTSTTASIYMASFNNATMKSVYTRGSFYDRVLQPRLPDQRRPAEPGDRDRRSLCQPADAVAGHLQLQPTTAGRA